MPNHFNYHQISVTYVCPKISQKRKIFHLTFKPHGVAAGGVYRYTGQQAYGYGGI